jgi:Rrf2 family protein
MWFAFVMTSARVHYAALAMLELAIRNDQSNPVAIREISDRHGVPAPFLTQILRSLRTAGWVQSVRGSSGGYRLSVDPTTVTLLDIATAVGCSEVGFRSDGQATAADRMLQAAWEQAAAAARDSLQQIRLSDLVERARHGEAAMFYI